MVKFTCVCSSGWVSRRGGVSQWNKAFGEAALEACRYWHREFLPIHMTHEAYGKYNNPESEPTYVRGAFIGYMARDASYTRWKEKRFKHTLPLVYKGKARSDTQANPHFRWSKEQKSGSIVAVVTFGIGNADRGRPGNELGIKRTSSRISSNQIREEFTVVSRDEAEQMASVMEKQLDKEIEKVMEA